jgi:hypothetical protein
MTGFVPNAGQPQPSAAGASIGSVGAALGGMLGEQTINQTTGGVQKLDSAKSGGFAINEQGADEYIKVFRNFQDVLSGLQDTLFNASQAPKLGGSDYAKNVASHTQLVASGDDQSYATALNFLSVVVSQAQAAFEEAKKARRADGPRSLCARLYGRRSASRRAAKAVAVATDSELG